MKYGVAIRNMGPQSTRQTLTACARIAEQAGFDALFVSDHLCLPLDQTEGSDGRYLDVLATLAFLAGVTDRVRLGISVLVLPYRPAVLTAKQVATIQELSGERMIVSTGVGWLKPEFDALGVDFRQRGALATETLRVLHHLFGRQMAAYQGKLVSFPDFVFLPRPKRPPIWVGGNGTRALERVLEFGDGWHPMLRSAELKAAVADLRARASERGRGELEIVVRRRLRFDDLGAARERLAADRDAGATYFVLDPGRYAGEREFAESVDSFVGKVAC